MILRLPTLNVGNRDFVPARNLPRHMVVAKGPDSLKHSAPKNQRCTVLCAYRILTGIMLLPCMRLNRLKADDASASTSIPANRQ